jgi:hypothetical protein
LRVHGQKLARCKVEPGTQNAELLQACLGCASAAFKRFVRRDFCLAAAFLLRDFLCFDLSIAEYSSATEFLASSIFPDSSLSLNCFREVRSAQCAPVAAIPAAMLKILSVCLQGRRVIGHSQRLLRLMYQPRLRKPESMKLFTLQVLKIHVKSYFVIDLNSSQT